VKEELKFWGVVIKMYFGGLKKLLSICLVVILVFGLVGCTPGISTTAAATLATTEVANASTAETTVAPTTSTEVATTVQVTTTVPTTAVVVTSETRPVETQPVDYVLPDLTGKNVYFTFDDGPTGYGSGGSSLTNDLLDILASCGVKATFFLCYYPGNGTEDIMRRAVAEGHQLAVHTASHEYGQIYSSVQAWKDDFMVVYNWILNTTGVAPKFYRFPGGSYGTATNLLRGNQAMFNEAVAFLHDLGMDYVDWNVSGDEGDGSLPVSTVLDRYLGGNGFSGPVKNYYVVLAHDHSGMRNSVEAMKTIMKKVVDAGANCVALDENAPKCQFSSHVWQQ